VVASGPVRPSAVADLASGRHRPVAGPARRTREVWHVRGAGVAGTLPRGGLDRRQRLVPSAARPGGHARGTRECDVTSAEQSGTCSARRSRAVIAPSASAGRCGSRWRHRVRRPRRGRARPTASSPGHAVTGSVRLREAIAFIRATGAPRPGHLPETAVLWWDRSCPGLPVWRARRTGTGWCGRDGRAYGAGGLLGAAGFGMVGSRVSRRRCTSACSSSGGHLCGDHAGAAAAGHPGHAAGAPADVDRSSAPGPIRQERSPAHCCRASWVSRRPIRSWGIGVWSGLLIDGSASPTLLLLPPGPRSSGSRSCASGDPVSTRARPRRGEARSWSPGLLKVRRWTRGPAGRSSTGSSSGPENLARGRIWRPIEARHARGAS